MNPSKKPSTKNRYIIEIKKPINIVTRLAFGISSCAPVSITAFLFFFSYLSNALYPAAPIFKPAPRTVPNVFAPLLLFLPSGSLHILP